MSVQLPCRLHTWPWTVTKGSPCLSIMLMPCVVEVWLEWGW